MAIEYETILGADLSSLPEGANISLKLAISEENELSLTLSEQFHIPGFQTADFSPFFHAIKSKGRIKFRSVFPHSFPFLSFLPLLSTSRSPQRPGPMKLQFSSDKLSMARNF